MYKSLPPSHLLPLPLSALELDTHYNTTQHNTPTQHTNTKQIMRMLERLNIYGVVSRQWVFVHTHDGVRAALAELMEDGENGVAKAVV